MNERMAINAPIQGSAADLIKKAMIDLDNYITSNNLKSKLLIQIHDELILLVPDSELELMKEQLPLIMSNVFDLGVPLTVSLDYGTDWYQLK
jgi:DNA polymerase-1